MNDDQFLKKTPMKPSAQFTQDLLKQLHELDQQEQDEMTVYTPTFNPPAHRTHPKTTHKLGVILGLVASIAIVFFGVSWLNSHNNHTITEPLQVAPPQPEFIQRIGEYGMFITAAFDEENNRATVLTTTGVYQIPLDDFSAEPTLIRPSNIHNNYLSYYTDILHLSQGETMIAIRADQTIEAIHIPTGESISTWRPQDISNIYIDTATDHQLTNNGTRYHLAICLNTACNQQTIATWDTTTGELLRTINGLSPFTYTEDGETLFYTRSKTQVIRHDIATGEETELLAVADEIGDIAVSFDQSLIAVMNKRPNAVELFLYDSAHPEQPIFDHKTVGQPIVGRNQQKIMFSEEGQYLLALGLEQMNYRLNLATQQVIYINLRELMNLNGIIPNSTHTLLMRFGSMAETLELQTLDTSPITVDTSDYFSGNSSLISFQALDDGVVWKSQGVSGQDQWRWGWQDGQLVAVEETLPSVYFRGGIVYSPDNQYSAFITDNGMLYIYNRQEDEVAFMTNSLHDINGNSQQPYNFVFDSENRLYAMYFDGTINIYDSIEGLIGTISGADTGQLSMWDTIAPDQSIIARFLSSGEYGQPQYQWMLIFLDGIDIIGQLIITNHIIISPLNIPTITFSPDGEEVLIGSFCPDDCSEINYAGQILDEVVIYHLALTEFREQFLAMADLPLDERVIEYSMPEPINYPFNAVRQITYRPNTDHQIAVQMRDNVAIMQLDGLEADLLYTLPSASLFSGKYIEFSPDGNILYINQDGFFDAWRLPEAE